MVDYPPYNIEKFITEIKDLDWSEMIEKTEQETERVYQLSFEVPEANPARDQESMVYIQKLQDFLYRFNATSCRCHSENC